MRMLLVVVLLVVGGWLVAFWLGDGGPPAVAIK